MRPVTPPVELVDDQHVLRTISVPDDLVEHVDPVEAIISSGPDGLAEIHVLIELEPGEARRLRATGQLWLTFLGGVTPFRISVDAPGEGD